MIRRYVDTDIFKYILTVYFIKSMPYFYLPPHYIFFVNCGVLNFGYLLFLLGNEILKNNIRNWKSQEENCSLKKWRAF